jgi:hypothetical protein
LPRHHRIRLNKDQRVTPIALNPRQTDPKQPIPLRQHKPFLLPLVSDQLQPQRKVLDSDSLVPRTQQSNEPKHTQNDSQYEKGLFSPEVSLLDTDIFLAMDNQVAEDLGRVGHHARLH